MYSAGAFFNLNDRNGFSAGFRYFGGPKVDLPDHTLKPKDMAIDVAYGYKLTDHLSIALTGRYIHSDMGGDAGAGKADAFAADLGVYYRNNISAMSGAQWSVGLQASNFGSELDYDGLDSYSLPARIKAGGSAYLPFSEDHRLTVSANLAYRLLPSDFSTFEAGLGLDYNLYKYAFIRAGYHLGDEEKGMGNFATLGVGASVAGFRLDASYWLGAPDEDFKNILFLSLSYRF